ncbi:MAG: hemerythrin domain-containing protein [Candidatus Micrarchaeia archaeon]
MNTIGILATEHRLIERMVKLLASELEKEKAEHAANTAFLRDAADFFRNYADKLHHGKEEDILFFELEKKPMSNEHRQMMAQLVAEHKIARENVAGLLEAAGRYEKGETDAIGELISRASRLVALYPPHIEMEDMRFFAPVMKYFTADEQARMLAACNEFDGKMAIEEKYRAVVERHEKGA